MKTYNEIVETWKSCPPQSVSKLDRYLDSFRILFAYHSGKIENDDITYRDTREIFETGRISGFTGNPKALIEQQNQKLCYEYLKQHIIDRTPITLSLICEIHRILTSGCYDERRFLQNEERPGEFKKHDYIIGINEVGSHPSEVESQLWELLEEINAYKGDNILKAAAYFHAMFEFIHPFSDGNGRAGRTLMNYYLMTHDHPPTVIYEEDRKDYVDALRQFDETEEIEPLYCFLHSQILKTWNRKRKERTRRLE